MTDLFDSMISSTSSIIREKVHSVNYEAIFWFFCSVEVLIILNWSANSFKSITFVPLYWSASKVYLVNSPSGLSLVQEATWESSSSAISNITLSTIYWGVSTLGFCSRITNFGPWYWGGILMSLNSLARIELILHLELTFFSRYRKNCFFSCHKHQSIWELPVKKP